MRLEKKDELTSDLILSLNNEQFQFEQSIDNRTKNDVYRTVLIDKHFVV